MPTVASRPLALALALVLALATSVGACVSPQDEDAAAGEGLTEDGGADDLGDGKADGIGERTCARGPTMKGIDVSKWQGVVNWSRVAESGVQFAFIRVSDGLGSLDPQFRANWANSRRVGIVRGAYQYFRPDRDPIAQADKLIAAIGTLEADDLPPVIDVETTSNQSAATVRARVSAWMKRVEQRLGRRPIIYTGSYFWRDRVGGGAEYATYPLWIAQYTSRCPRLPSPWQRWTFWQSSQTGRVPGISGAVDLDTFDGDRAALTAFIDRSKL